MSLNTQVVFDVDKVKSNQQCFPIWKAWQIGSLLEELETKLRECKSLKLMIRDDQDVDAMYKETQQ